jgi:L-amino acid N-acyltransferase YncA
VRDATVADAEACAAIYAPYVRDTAITFETAPPSAEAMAGRISAALATHAWLVLEDGGQVVGYAYGGPSVGLHRALGFQPIGTFRRIGGKNGAWHDVAWMQRELLPHDDGAPAEPI